MEEQKNSTEHMAEFIRAITGLLLAVVLLWNFTKPMVDILNSIPSMMVHTSTVTVGGVEFNIDTNLAVAPSEPTLKAVANLTQKEIDHLLANPNGFSSNQPQYHPLDSYKNLENLGLWEVERDKNNLTVRVTPLGNEARSFLLRTLFYVTDTL